MRMSKFMRISADAELRYTSDNWWKERRKKIRVPLRNIYIYIYNKYIVNVYVYARICMGTHIRGCIYILYSLLMFIHTEATYRGVDAHNTPNSSRKEELKSKLEGWNTNLIISCAFMVWILIISNQWCGSRKMASLIPTQLILVEIPSTIVDLF